MNQMKMILESWRQTLNERVYSDVLHSFIQFSYELDELVKNGELHPSDKRYKLFNFIENNKFQYLGGGVSRSAWQTPSGEVVKIAHNMLETRENKLEIEKFNRSDIEAFPRMLAHDEEDYLWYIVEKVTPIGKTDTWEKYSKLFPKFFKMFEEMQTKLGFKIPPNSEYDQRSLCTYTIMNMLLLKWEQKNRADYRNSFEQNVMSMFRISRDQLSQNADIHKEATNALIMYFKDPDVNFARLLRAVVDADVHPGDFHFNNLAYDKDWNIKIIDAA